MPIRNLTKNASFENLKNQAKTLHKSLRQSLNTSPEAIRRVSTYFESPEKVSLQNVQLVIAREYGFDSWKKLRAQIALAAGLCELPEQRLAKSILKTSDLETIQAFVGDVLANILGWKTTHLFRFELSVGAAFGIENEDGQRCLLKVLGPDETQAANHRRAFQAWIHERGFPCPAIICPVSRFNGLQFVIEEYLDVGRHADGHLPADRALMANELHNLISLSRDYPNKNSIPADTLLRQAGSVWPKPHNIYFDFAATKEGAEWIDEAGAASWSILDKMEEGNVIAHMDWSAKHFLISGDAVSVIYDWDSVARVTETRAVGSAAAVFAYSEYIDKDNRPNANEVQGFLADYQQARGSKFSASELQEIHACIGYTAAYGARCEHAIDHANPGDDARRFLRMLLSDSDLGLSLHSVGR